MANALETVVDANAQKPASGTVDGNTVTQHNLRDQIAAAKFLGSRTAAASDLRGLIFNKIVPPSAE